MKTNTKGLEVKTLKILPVWNLNIIKKDTLPYPQYYKINLFEIVQVFRVFWVWQ